MKLRRTKILATLGPATDQPGVLEDMFKAGLDVVRLNFSHGDAESQKQRAATVRKVSKETGHLVGILADLQGPKIRIARFSDDKIDLQVGADFAIDMAWDGAAGNQEVVGCDYADLAKDVKAGSTLLLDDGRIVLSVKDIVRNRINCTVKIGGVLSNNKGINLFGGGLSAPALSEKDKRDIVSAAEIDADFLAVSFPRCAKDINTARLLLEAAGGKAAIIAKIERTEALENIEEIIEASDGIMIARGDLGVEIGDALLPPVQKRLITQARRMKRIVITATQMMETMIENPIPTRAEVFDVANAVFDGTDAVMLSAETAVGKHPIKVIQNMDRICRETERQPKLHRDTSYAEEVYDKPDEAIAGTTMFLANHYDIKAIAALTESGWTALCMSRVSSGIPIFAMTSHVKTSRMANLYRGVYPVLFKAESTVHSEVNLQVIKKLKSFGAVVDGDKMIITKGDLIGVEGTSALKIATVS